MSVFPLMPVMFTKFVVTKMAEKELQVFAEKGVVGLIGIEGKIDSLEVALSREFGYVLRGRCIPRDKKYRKPLFFCFMLNSEKELKRFLKGEFNLCPDGGAASF